MFEFQYEQYGIKTFLANVQKITAYGTVYQNQIFFRFLPLKNVRRGHELCSLISNYLGFHSRQSGAGAISSSTEVRSTSCRFANKNSSGFSGIARRGNGEKKREGKEQRWSTRVCMSTLLYEHGRNFLLRFYASSMRPNAKRTFHSVSITSITLYDTVEAYKTSTAKYFFVDFRMKMRRIVKRMRRTNPLPRY